MYQKFLVLNNLENSNSGDDGISTSKKQGPVVNIPKPLSWDSNNVKEKNSSSEFDQIQVNEENSHIDIVVSFLLSFENSKSMMKNLQQLQVRRDCINFINSNSKIILTKVNNESIFIRLIKMGYSDQSYQLMKMLCFLFKFNSSIKIILLKILSDLMFGSYNSLFLNYNEVHYIIDNLLNFNNEILKKIDSHVIQIVRSQKLELPLKEINSSSIPYGIQYEFFRFLIYCSLISKNALLASALYIDIIKHYESSSPNFVNYILLNKEILNLIIQSLLIKSPLQDDKQIITIIKLHEFQNEMLDNVSASINNKKKEGKDASFNLNDFKFKLSPSQLSTVIENTLILDDDVYLNLKTEIFRKILDIYFHNFTIKSNDDQDAVLHNNQLDLYLRYTYKLIEHNIAYNNEPVVYLIWSRIKKLHTVKYNSQMNSVNNNADNEYYYYSILAKMIRFFSKNQRYRYLVSELIADLPIRSCLVNPDLMDALLFHSSRTSDFKLSEVLIAELNKDSNSELESLNYSYVTHLTRGQLSALLALHLKFQDSEGVEKIVKLIYERYPKGLSHVELNLICRSMLYNTGLGNRKIEFEKVWKMFQTVSPYVSKSLFITILDYMIEHNVVDFYKINLMFCKMTQSIDYRDEVWNWFTTSYFKFLLKNHPLEYSKEVYMNSISDKSIFFKNEMNLRDISNPFAQRYDKVQLFIPTNLKKFIIKMIADQAILQKNTTQHESSIIYWCISELERLGFSFKEILIDWSLTKKAQLRKKLGFDILNDEKLVNKFGLNKLKTQNNKNKMNKNLIIKGSTQNEQSVSAAFDKTTQYYLARYVSMKTENKSKKQKTDNSAKDS
ncbi:hypothetical protein PACTADRAFT_51355 [Pachysolen tannophilus NRRL Y-2460]|uniref:Uncharacterized protein n=1 Tax=Pachysolen tannophilus NRRL Y-2460 TaxID=669874 RepID=A0A1E4TPA0_PACTA|nr:hypothetical protein PACTADRAFT_51355 [Pachysolen tannophilus NRRL Y-2460]